MRLRRQHVLFPPEQWNVREIDERAKTNNAVEAWHRRFETMFHANTRHFYKMLLALKKEQQHSEATIIRAEAGEPPKKRRRSLIARYGRIRQIVNTWNPLNTIPYLRGIAHNFTF